MSEQIGRLSSFDATDIRYAVHPCDDPDAAGPDVLLCDGIGCAGFIWRHLTGALTPGHRVVHPHYRGHGESGDPKDPGAVGIGHLVTDQLAVLDAVGIEQAVVIGHSMGVQVSLELWRRAPERVKALVLICGSYENPTATFHDRPHLHHALPYMQTAARWLHGPLSVFWRTMVDTPAGAWVARVTEINADKVRPSDFAPYLTDLARIDPVVFVDMLAGTQAHSAGRYLHTIDVPVLVVAGEADQFTPSWLSTQMAHRIPTAELVEVPGGTHIAPLEQPVRVNLEINRFLNRHFG
ncbi:MAG: alpha/beta fold hydrolase [Planctomycetota bacterium]